MNETKEQNPFLEAGMRGEVPSTTLPHSPAAHEMDKIPPMEGQGLEGAIADTTGYIEIPSIGTGAFSRIASASFAGSAALFSVLFLVLAFALRSQSFGKALKYFEKLLIGNKLASALAALVLALVAFKFPNSLVFGEGVRLSGFQILSFMDALACASFALGLLVVVLSKKNSVLLGPDPLALPGNKYLSLGLMALIASSLIFLGFTESMLSVWIFCLTVFAYSYFSFAKLEMAELEKDLAGLFPFLAAFSAAMLGAAIMWWPVLLFFSLLSGSLLANALKPERFWHALGKALKA